jgi:hypothetical protein
MGISSVSPTPAPLRAAVLRSASVAPAALALSLASPAPAPVARPAARGIPAPGIRVVSPSPANEPSASPNLRPTSSSEPASGLSASLRGAARLCIPRRALSSSSSSRRVAAPIAPSSLFFVSSS